MARHVTFAAYSPTWSAQCQIDTKPNQLPEELHYRIGKHGQRGHFGREDHFDPESWPADIWICAMTSDSFKVFVLDRLSDPGDVTARSMFGGLGLRWGKAFFTIIHRDRLFFKTDADSRAAYEQRGMRPFQPNDRQTMKYRRVPADIVEDRLELLAWARRAVSISHVD